MSYAQLDSCAIIDQITIQHDLSLVYIQRRGLITLPMLPATIFMTAAEIGCPILTITQSSAEGNFCLGVPRIKAKPFVNALTAALYAEIEHRWIDQIWARSDVVGVTIQPHQEARYYAPAQVCDHLAEHQINLLAVSLGAITGELSLVIESTHADHAWKVLQRLV